MDPSACDNAPGDVALYTNADSFVGAHVAMFDALWEATHDLRDAAMHGAFALPTETRASRGREA